MIEDIRLEAEIAKLLEDIADLGNINDMARSDYQAILEAKAKQIIKKVRENGSL